MSLPRGGSGFRLSQLNLTAEQRDAVGEAMSSAIAVNVYRELQRARQEAERAQSGCNIIGNCSCSSKELAAVLEG